MTRALLQLLGRLLRETRGGIAVSFAVAAPALLCMIGVAVDYANMSYMKAGLQAVADGAAIAGAQELSLPNVKQPQMQTLRDQRFSIFVS